MDGLLYNESTKHTKPHCFRLSIPSFSNLAIVLLLTSHFILLTACSERRTPVELANEEGILLLGNGTDPKDLDPQLTTGLVEFKILTGLFEGLTLPNPKTSEPEPGVAESWTTNEDMSVYTFKLREDAKWSNGDPVTAHDFVFSYERILSPAYAAEYASMLFPIRNAREFNSGELEDFGQVGVKALDDHTLELALVGPTPHFPTMLGHMTYFPVHPPTILKHGEMTDRNTRWTRPGNHVSNGPFQLAAWNLNDRVSLRRNPHYWDAETVQLNGIDFIPITNLNTEERAFRSGQLHLTDSLPFSKRVSYRDADSPYLNLDPWLATYFYLFNTTEPPFDDPRVRRAFAMAIDRQALVDTVTNGQETIAFHIVPPFLSGYDSPESPIVEDIDTAQALMAEAGYPDGRGFPTIELLYNSSDAHRPIAEAIQQMWHEKLNVNVELINQSWPVYLDNRVNRNYTVARAGWIGDYYDASTFLTMWTSDSGLNHTGWGNPAFDKLIKQAEQEGDPQKRLAILREAESVFLEATPIIPLYYYNRIFLKRPEVQGWYPNILDEHPYKYVWLETKNDEG